MPRISDSASLFSVAANLVFLDSLDFVLFGFASYNNKLPLTVHSECQSNEGQEQTSSCCARLPEGGHRLGRDMSRL